MEGKNQLFGLRDGLWLKGLAMLVFGLVAFCYPGEEIRAMHTPFAILLILNGLGVWLTAVYFTDDRKRYRRWMRIQGGADLLMAIFVLWSTNWITWHLTDVLSLWLMITGTFILWRGRPGKDFDYSKQIHLGIVYLGLGGVLFIYQNVLTEDWPYLIPVVAVLLGIYLWIQIPGIVDHSHQESYREKAQSRHPQESTTG